LPYEKNIKPKKPPMKVKGNHNLTQKEQETLINQITPYVDGISYKPNIKVTIGKKQITCNYSKTHKSITVTKVEQPKEATTQPPTEPTILDKALKDGTVTKKGNWYTYQGKNYLGKNKITAALSK
jgi:hypothetical protein